MSETRYGRSLSAARKIIEARQEALRGFQGASGLLDRFARLTLADLPEAEDAHAPEYVGAILEFAAQHVTGHGAAGDTEHQSPEDRGDPRKFAQHFLSKQAAYSRTPNGVAAVQFESWLLEASGYLFSRFVETVLESGNKFVAVFQGKLNEEELRRMRTGTAGFMTFEPIIEAGKTNGDEVFEFTLFDCTASKRASRDKHPQLAQTPTPDSDADVSLPGTALKEGRLLPGTPEEYLTVLVEGGVTTEALELVAGAEVFDTLIETQGANRVVDSNGVVWEDVDAAGQWLPVLGCKKAPVDEDDEPLGYRVPLPTDRGVCGSCAFFQHLDPDEGMCTLYDVDVQRDMTCSDWKARDVRMSERVVSDFGTWDLRQTEDGDALVTLDNAVWELSDYETIRSRIVEIGEAYAEELSAERDLMVEALLRDVVTRESVTCDDELPDDLEECRRAERDALVAKRNRERVEESTSKIEVDELCVVEEEVRESYPDVVEGSELWHRLCVSAHRSLQRTDERKKEDADDDDDATTDDEGDAGKKA